MCLNNFHFTRNRELSLETGAAHICNYHLCVLFFNSWKAYTVVNRQENRCCLWLASLQYAIYTNMIQKEECGSILKLCFSCQIYRDRHKDNNKNVISARFDIAPGLQRSYLLCVPVSRSVQSVCVANKFISSLHFICFQKKWKCPGVCHRRKPGKNGSWDFWQQSHLHIVISVQGDWSLLQKFC